MKPITVNLPEKYLEALETLTKTKYIGKSEAIMAALKKLFEEEFGGVEVLGESIGNPGENNPGSKLSNTLQNNKMRVTSFKISEALYEGLQELVERGMYRSLAEAVREAVRTLLRRELWR